MKNSRGYTLVELVVAVGLFALIMTLVSGAYFMMISITQKAQGMASGIDNLAFALETMTRNIRTGTDYNDGVDCSNCTSFSVTSTTGGSRKVYDAVGGVIRQNNVPLTDPSVAISSITFSVSGTTKASGNDYAQPYVIIRIIGTVSGGPGKPSESFDIRTSAVMRTPDL